MTVTVNGRDRGTTSTQDEIHSRDATAPRVERRSLLSRITAVVESGRLPSYSPSASVARGN